MSTTLPYTRRIIVAFIYRKTFEASRGRDVGKDTPISKEVADDLQSGEEVFRLYDSASLGNMGMKFRINGVGDYNYHTASLSLCNIAREDMEALTQWADYGNGFVNRKRVLIYAGYGNSVTLLFNGQVWQSLPTAPPDVWLNFELLANFDGVQEIMPNAITFEGTSRIIDVVSAAAKMMGVNLTIQARNREALDKELYQFSYFGNMSGLISHIKSLNTKLDFQLTGTDFIVRDNIDSLRDRAAKGESIPADIWIGMAAASYGNVLLKVPAVSPYTFKVATLLNPSVSGGMVVEIESKQIPSLKGQRWLTNRWTHIADLRGDTWITELQGFRITQEGDENS